MTTRLLDGRFAIVTGAAVGMGPPPPAMVAAASASVLVSNVDEANGQATVDAIAVDGGQAAHGGMKRLSDAAAAAAQG